MKTVFKLPSQTNIAHARIPNYIIDMGLSPEAVYIYLWLAIKPDNWEISKGRDLAKQVGISRDKTFKALLELEKVMLYVRDEIRDENGKIVKYIRELHVAPYPEIPDTVPCPGNAEAVNFKNQEKTIACERVCPRPENQESVEPRPEKPGPGKSGPITKKDITKKKPPTEVKMIFSLDSDLQIAVEEFNSMASRTTHIRSVAQLTPKRKKHLSARLKDHGLDGWRQALGMVERSSFLCGESKDWRLNFTWLIESPDNFLKVLEGQYGNGRVRTAAKRPPEELSKLKAELLEIGRKNTECVVK